MARTAAGRANLSAAKGLEQACCRRTAAFVSRDIMTVVLDHTAGKPRHPEKAHRPDSPALRKPDWIRVKAPVSPGYAATHAVVREHGLHTVCEEAGCPNI